jgi:hypothetical protein
MTLIHETIYYYHYPLLIGAVPGFAFSRTVAGRVSSVGLAKSFETAGTSVQRLSTRQSLRATSKED